MLDRREFLGAALDAATLTALTGALRPLHALAAAGDGAPVFFDPRFAAARAAAQQLAGDGAVRAVFGDPAELLHAFTAHDAGRFVLRGVTTESLPFCLEQLLARGGRPQLHIGRLDQDLFAWRMEFTA